jgi:hypothetical protein
MSSPLTDSPPTTAGLTVLRAGTEPGEVTIRITADGCEPVTVTIPTVAPNGKTAQQVPA